MALSGQLYYNVCKTRVGHAALRRLLVGMRRLGFMRGFKMPLDALELDHEAVVGLMELWSRVHWSSGYGMMPPEQLLAIYRLAIEWPAEGDIVELGAWVGLTTSYLTTACRVGGWDRTGSKVYAVDTFEGTMEGGTLYPSITDFDGTTLGTFNEHLRRAGGDDLVEPLVGLTSEVARKYPGGPIRLLLIDADHSYEGVSGDFALWLPHVATGGLIVFHDYAMPEAGVARFVDEQVSGNPAIEMSPGHVVENVMAVTKKADAGGPSAATREVSAAAGERSAATCVRVREGDRKPVGVQSV